MKRNLILVIGLICLLLVPLASAKYISIVPKISSDVIEEDFTNLQVVLEQRGDEAAYDVEAVPIVPNSFSIEGSMSAPRFDPGVGLKGNFEISVEEDIKEGKYPVVVQIIYHDANMYPFSTVSHRLITYKTSSVSNVHGSFESVEIEQEGSGEFLLKVRNLDDIPHDITINLYLPKELTSNKQKEIVNVGAKEEKEIKYEISSIGALPDSTYAALASLEYEDDLHHTSFATGIIKIVEKKENPNLLVGMIALFAVLLIAFVMYKIKTKNKPIEETKEDNGEEKNEDDSNNSNFE